MLTVKLRHAAR